MIMAKRIVVAITGASGMIYARRLLELVADANVIPDIIISEAARGIIATELGGTDEPSPMDSRSAMKYFPIANYTLHQPDNLAAPVSSGSVMVDGMVIVPCSMNTLGKVAAGIADNLICRAAGVMLKEHRKLIIVPREMPLSAIHLENMLRLSQAGAVILPPCPSFYKRPDTIDDLVDTVVARILDHLGIEHKLNIRWSPE